MEFKKRLELFNSEKLLLYFSIFILIACFILEIFIILNFPLAGNEAFFATRATYLMEDGEIPNTLHFNNHAPFAIYFLGLFSVFFELTTQTLHLAAFFWEFLTLILIFFISKKYFGTTNAIVASAIFIVFSISFSGTIYNSEYPSAFFGLLAIFFYLLFLEKRNAHYLITSGLILSLSKSFKQPGFLFFLAILIHQLYLFSRKKQSLPQSLKNITLVTLSVLILSVPFLTYFLYHAGWMFIYDLFIFNIVANPAHSRFLIAGKFLRMMVQSFGLFIIIIFGVPAQEKESKNNDLISFLWIASIIFILFYFMSYELFNLHLINLLVIIIPLSMFYFTKYTQNSLRVIRIVLIIFLFTTFMVSLEITLREHQKGEKFKQEEIKQYLLFEIPEDSAVYSIHDNYYFLTGFKSTYRYTTVQPNIDLTKFKDFCNYLDTLDYIILTKIQKKHIGAKNLNCVYSKFTSIKTFENIDATGQGNVEILKRTPHS